jgi:hypothetical protein
LAFELWSAWAAPNTKAKQAIAPATEALMTAIDGYRRRATAVGHTVEQVIRSTKPDGRHFAGALAHRPGSRDPRRPAFERAA